MSDLAESKRKPWESRGIYTTSRMPKSDVVGMRPQVPHSNQPLEYNDFGFWDDRYSKQRKEFGQQHHFEWHATFDQIRPIFESFLGANDGKRVLVVGCGNSRMSEGVSTDLGFHNVVSVDQSPFVVAQMQERYKGLEGLDFLVMDVRKMNAFCDHHFDIVIDKACIDSLYTTFSSLKNVDAAYREIYRVLKPGGIYASVSSGTPETRVPHLTAAGLFWIPEAVRIPHTEGKIAYITFKAEDAVAQEEARAAEVARIAAAHARGKGDVALDNTLHVEFHSNMRPVPRMPNSSQRGMVTLLQVHCNEDEIT